MDFSGPDAIDNAIKAGLDIDGSPLPEAMLTLYREVMDQEAQVGWSVRPLIRVDELA